MKCALTNTIKIKKYALTNVYCIIKIKKYKYILYKIKIRKYDLTNTSHYNF